MNILTAYPAFFTSFKTIFKSIDPNISVLSCDVIDTPSDIKSLVKRSDLIIFTGGEDISPDIYGGKPAYYYNKTRDTVEINVLENALNNDKYILGVCRGHQLINAVLGGKLIQDMHHPGYHSLDFIKTSILQLEKIFKRGVNSLHHQAVEIPGKDMEVTSKFGEIIESTEHVNKKIWTVQFHPEFMNSVEFFITVINTIKGKTNV